MENKECTNCGETKDIDEFYFRSKKTGKRRSWCSCCVKEYNKSHYKNNKKDYIDNKLHRVDKLKNKMWDYLDNKECIDCGEQNKIVLEFDHVRGEKRTEVSEMVHYGFGWETIIKEIKKCDIVCANCHKIRTTNRGNHWRLRI